MDLRWRMRGLLASVERKNGRRLAEWAGHHGPAGFRHLLNSASWDADAVRDADKGYVAGRLGTESGVPGMDDTGFLRIVTFTG
ncbi:transposase [Streptomyces tsukubensis]